MAMVSELVVIFEIGVDGSMFDYIFIVYFGDNGE